MDQCAFDLERTEKKFCDVNAYCYNFKAEGSYACLCKDGFEGNGKVGNCKAINNQGIVKISVTFIIWKKENFNYFSLAQKYLNN